MDVNCDKIDLCVAVDSNLMTSHNSQPAENSYTFTLQLISEDRVLLKKTDETEFDHTDYVSPEKCSKSLSLAQYIQECNESRSSDEE